MATAPTLPTIRRPARAGARARGPRRPGRDSLTRSAGGALGTLGLAVATVPVAVLVLLAAARPSVLSGPALRGGPGAAWTLGPLQGLLQSAPSAPSVLHRYLLLAIVVGACGWLLAWVTAPRLPLRVVAGAVLAVHVVLFLGPPLPLTDVFNYGLYGRMATAHGLNPYRALPAQVPGDPLYALANWHHLRSPYGPLFTLGSEGLSRLGVHAWFWIWKLIVALTSLGSIAIAADLAGRLGVSRQRVVAAVGLSPLLLIGEVGGLHQDMPAVACVLGAAWCLVRAREEDAPAWCDPAAGALVVIAAGIKPSFAIVAGIIVLGARRRAWAAAGAGAAGVLLGLVVLLAYGGALPDVSTQSTLVGPLSVPNLLGLAAGHGGADAGVRSVAQALLIAFTLVATGAVALRRERALSALGVLLFASILTLSWVMPWYLVWSLPFIALSRPRALAPLAVVATCWLTVASLSTLPGVLHWAGYYPTHLSTGKANHVRLERLVK